MSEELEKYHKAILALKNEIVNDVSERCVPEFQKVVDYATREVADMIAKVEASHLEFKETYDNRLDNIEETQAILEKNHEILEAKLLPKWFLFGMVFAIILCLIVIIILIITDHS